MGLTAPIVAVQAAPNGDIGVPPPGKAGWYDGLAVGTHGLIERMMGCLCVTHYWPQ